MAEETEYQTFFKKALEKAGKSIPSMSDEEKKAFFNKIDAAWDGKGEKNEELTDKQKQLDIDGDGEIEASDLAALRAGEKVEESHDCGCGCGGVTEGGCSTNISEGKHDKTLDMLANLVKGAKSFMDIGKELKKAKIKDYHFSTSMLPMYVINIGGAKVAILNKKYADGAERIVGTTAIGLMESVNEGMFGLIDQIRQDSKDVRDFVKNVFKDRDFMKMKNDKEFIKYLKSIYEGVDESKGVPQNYMQGRTSDYHTALRGKNRDYSGGTNFKKNNHGQPDIEKDDEDQETNQLSVQQTKLKEEMGKLSSSERIELYKLYSKAMKAMPGSPNQKKLKVIINKLRKKADLKPLPINEAKLDHHRISGNSIELLVRHNREKFAIRFKDKRILDKMGFDWSKPKNIEKLLSLKKFPKGMSVSRSFHESLNEVKVETERYFGKKGIIIMIRDGNKLISAIFKDKKNADKFNRNKPADVKKLYQLAQKTKFPKTIDEYGQRLDLSFIDDKEARLKGTPEPKDAIDRDIEEYSGGSYEYTKGDQYGQNSVNEIGVFPVQNYVKGIIPSNFINTTTKDKKERLKSTLRDLKNTLNHFWKQHKIPYRVK